jgi:hypothetical protein
LIDETNWEISPELKSLFFKSNFSLLRPLCVDNDCLFRVKSTTEETDYFGIRVCNLTGQCSVISNILLSDFY